VYFFVIVIGCDRGVVVVIVSVVVVVVINGRRRDCDEKEW
jgi:hypothetical protein